MAGRFSVQGVFRVVDRMTRPIRQIDSRLERFRRNVSQGFRGLGQFVGRFKTAALAAFAAVGAGLAAIGAGIRDVINTGAEFDSVMAMAGARFGVSRGAAEFGALEQAAFDAARTSQFSARDAAQALAELGASGTSARDAIITLPTLINTATAAEMELGAASDILTDQLTAFGLASEDSAQLGRNLARVSDVMAAGANDTSQSFDQLTSALVNVSAGAHSAGLDIETTTALIGALADQGQKGERAGTGLNAMLNSLRNPTRQATQALRRVGVETRNADGTFRDAIDIVQSFEEAFAGLNDAARDRALGQIFSSDGRRSMQLLLASGSQGLRDLRTGLQSAGGSAEEMARMMRDSAAGDMQSMSSAIEALKLEIWSLIRGPVRQIVTAITEWVRANQDVIASGLQAAIEWLIENMPTIVAWARRIGIVLAVVGAVIGAVVAFAVTSLALLSGSFAAVVFAIIEGVLWLVDIATTAWEAISEAFTAAWSRVTAFFTAALEFIVGLFVIIGRFAMRLLRPAFDMIGRAAGWIRRLWAPVGAFFGAIWDRISADFSGAVDWLVGESSWLYDWLVRLWTPIGAFFDRLWDGIADSFVGAFSWIVDAVNGVRAEGRAAMADDDREGGGVSSSRRQVVSPQERVARSVSETTSTERSEVTIRDESGRAEVTRRPRRARGRIRLEPSGAM